LFNILVDFAPIFPSNWDLYIEVQSSSVKYDIWKMKELEDQILVRRVLETDPESFGELCRRYYQSLVAVADSILMDHHLAEDAAQETLAAACRQLAKLKKPERFGPWIVAICRNVAKDMLRERQRQRKPVKARQEQESDCQNNDQSAILAEALQHLPQNLREVIFLRFYNEMSYRQMAKVLGVTEQVIDGRIRRAKKKMTFYLKKVGFKRCDFSHEE
jgi:RNA polymerase sigma-70 factor (ECF subfamily)